MSPFFILFFSNSHFLNKSQLLEGLSLIVISMKAELGLGQPHRM
jgi:hypothetical protein